LLPLALDSAAAVIKMFTEIRDIPMVVGQRAIREGRYDTPRLPVIDARYATMPMPLILR